MQSKFFAFMARMKFVNRWSLMRNTTIENIAEHSLNVSMIAHCLALIENKFYGGQYDVFKIGMMGAYHETSEVITGDLATPVKYFNPEIKLAYKQIERVSLDKIKSMIPEEIKSHYDCLDGGNEYEEMLVKAADKISAYFKCVEELKSGNTEFSTAKDTLLASVKAFELPEVEYFMEHFADSIGKTLDELN